jgi:23S rRNA U2552 (ribose-2'-O)-methylase RlmE/FtsJ
MPRRLRLPAPPHTCEYREAVARVQVELEQIQAMHGRTIMVSSAKVLDLLNPRGMWRYIDQATEPMAQVGAEDTADLDPITGCKSVAARQRPAS